MRTDKYGTRLDIRFPSDLYSEIKQIAAETNQPVHHISKEPMVTPLILNLVRLGIEQFKREGFIQHTTDNLQDKQSQKKLREYVDEKIKLLKLELTKQLNELRELIQHSSYAVSEPEEEDLLDDDDDDDVLYIIKPSPKEVGEIQEIPVLAKVELPPVARELASQDNVGALLSELKTKKAISSENQPLLDLVSEAPPVSGSEERVVELMGNSYRVRGQGMTQSALAQRLIKGERKILKPDNGARISKMWKQVVSGEIALSAFINWTQTSDREGKGWVKDGELFYEVVI